MATVVLDCGNSRGISGGYIGPQWYWTVVTPGEYQVAILGHSGTGLW